MTAISLDCLTLTDCRPIDLVEAAGAAGFEMVSLWVQPPSIYPLQLVTPAMESGLRSALSGTGICVSALEVFDLSGPEDVERYLPALEMGARLGATSATAIHLANPDISAVADALALFSAAALQVGLSVTIEPVSMGVTRTLADAVALILQSGAEVGITLDFIHLARTGQGAADIAAIDPGLIKIIQICDGKRDLDAADVLAEATGERLYPGSGELALHDFLQAIATAVPRYTIECPSLARVKQGMTHGQQAREAMASVRRLLDACGIY